MKQLAIIDMGTNTFHLLIGTEKGDVIFKKRVHVLLGKDRIDKDVIGAEAIQRALAAIIEFNATIKDYKIDTICAIATEGFRSASNSQELIALINSKTGIEVDVITGEMEAELIYFGVRQTVEIKNETVLIMDVGGGSVEFIIANQSGVLDIYSFTTGAAYLLHEISPSDPITKQEISSTCQYLNNMLEPLFQSLLKYKPTVLIGSSGSFETIADMIAVKSGKTEELLQKDIWDIKVADFEAVYDRLINSTFAERILIPGMLIMRADMIVLAMVLIDLVRKTGNFKKILMSKNALKEGLLWAHFNSQTT